LKKRIFRSQRGSLPLIILGIVVLLAGIGLAGWYVWQKRDKTEPQTSTNQQKSENSGKKEAVNVQPDPSEGGKYLVIKEWGVKLPLSDDISGAYYEFSAEAGVEYVALYDRSFDALKNVEGTPCKGNNAYQFYSISRALPESTAEMEEGGGPEYRAFSFDMKYLFSGLGAHQAPPPCASLNSDPYGEFQGDQNILDIANDKEQAFDRAFGNLQKAD